MPSTIIYTIEKPIGVVREKHRPEAIIRVVTELSGRPIPVANGWFAKSLRRNGRVYVACAKGSPGAEQYGEGFIVGEHTILT